jgi:hypothetical protein
MKALEHIAGILGVSATELLTGAVPSQIPQSLLLEARRLIESGDAFGSAVATAVSRCSS